MVEGARLVVWGCSAGMSGVGWGGGAVVVHGRSVPTPCSAAHGMGSTPLLPRVPARVACTSCAVVCCLML